MKEGQRKNYWLKLDKDFFKHHDIRIIESMPNGKDYIIFYLKLLCESITHNGELRFSEEIPYNEQMLSSITNTNVDIVRSAIKIFAELKMMSVLDDGTYYLQRVIQMTGSESASYEATRKRIYREKQKELQVIGTHNGTNCPREENRESNTKRIIEESESLEYRDKSKEYRDKNIIKESNLNNIKKSSIDDKEELKEKYNDINF